MWPTVRVDAEPLRSQVSCLRSADLPLPDVGHCSDDFLRVETTSNGRRYGPLTGVFRLVNLRAANDDVVTTRSAANDPLVVVDV